MEELVADVQSGRFHSVLGDRLKARGTYREFIVYEAFQAYPEYVTESARAQSYILS